ncbi:hypothetical protein CTAYLR_005480 [Chrysophaeum taylorii]|uniref:GST N-terminal domain-containing protein n=1 Tax=Chrysophaeum taylorii TaxID=2483200 RepID=A0AAD7U4M5_9STRA|nr:hypothetical protein CTAYLR_005480 [Chrysophaeum taylorii]
MSSLPEGYVPPKVWELETSESPAGSNNPVSGARKEQTLPVGDAPIQLYSLGTPNGLKISIMLEELKEVTDVSYDPWLIKFGELDQFGSDFVKINPNSKIPAMVDKDFDPPLRVFESGSILLHLAQKYDAFIPKDAASRVECMNWLFWQIGGAPFIGGGFGHFYHYAPIKIH